MIALPTEMAASQPPDTPVDRAPAASLPAHHWARSRLAVVDTETTGLDPSTGDRIVEVGVVVFEDGAVRERWGTLIDPGRPLPPDTSRITGIQPDDVLGMPAFADIADALLERLDGCLLVAYNASFDRGFLLHELGRCGRTLPAGAMWIDPLVLAKELQRGQGNMKLGSVAKRLGVPLDEAHRACADAECAGWVLLALAAGLPAEMEQVLDLHETWEAQQNIQRNTWKSRQKPGTVGAAEAWTDDGLGPAYPHGDELDPIRYMFLRGTGRI